MVSRAARQKHSVRQPSSCWPWPSACARWSSGRWRRGASSACRRRRRTSCCSSCTSRCRHIRGPRCPCRRRRSCTWRERGGVSGGRRRACALCAERAVGAICCCPAVRRLARPARSAIWRRRRASRPVRASRQPVRRRQERGYSLRVLRDLRLLHVLTERRAITGGVLAGDSDLLRALAHGVSVYGTVLRGGG